MDFEGQKKADIERFRTAIPELASLDDLGVSDLYSMFSEQYFAAGWMAVNDALIETFKEYLLKTPLELYVEKLRGDGG